MSRISIQNLSKSFGARDLFDAFSLEVTPGMRLAVVGPNGCGKSTFLRILAGLEDPDSGQVSMPPGTQLGYSMQELSEDDLSTPVTAWVLAALPSWSEFWERWERATEAGDAAALAELGKEQAHLEHAFGYNPEYKARAVLTGLGFEARQLDAPLRELSGGWRERAKLARILVEGAGALLLDEPTNHLDLEAVEWLEDYLRDFQGALVFVAHDRVLLDRVSSHVLFLGGVKPVVRRGTFTQFLAWMDETEEQRRREEQRVQDEIARKMQFVERFQFKATKARQANSMKKQVAKLQKELEGVKPEARTRELKFSWPEPERPNHTVLSAIGLQVGYERGRSLWNPLDFHVYAGQKIALAGPNGCGKTTLLKAVTGHLEPMAGSLELGTKMRVGYFSQHQAETLDLGKPVLAEIRRLSDQRTTEGELMSVLGRFLLGEAFFDRPVGELSGGEKNRLILASLFLRRANFLVLDEPTNHLDLESRDVLIESLQDYPGTILMVAHDRYLMRQVAREVWWLRPGGIEVFPGGFDDYDHARKEALAGGGAAGAGGGKAASAGNGGDQAEQRLGREELKALRRAQAEERNRLYRELKPHKAKYEALEAELEAVMNEQSEVEQALADPDVYADAPRSTELMQRFGELNERSEKLMARMEPLETRIAKLEARRAELSGQEDGA